MLWTLLACSRPTSPPGTATVLPDVTEPQWFDEPVDDLVLARRFRALLPQPAEVVVRCGAVDDPTEAHELVLPAGEELAEGVLYGLLADTTYACETTSGDATATTTFTTDPLPDWLPSWHLSVPGTPWGGYVLLNHGTDLVADRRTKLLVVDVDGRLRWYRSIPYDAPDLDAQYIGEGYFVWGGGYAAPPTMSDLSGKVWLQARELANGELYNHHAERLEDGSLLAIETSDNRAEGKTWRGVKVERLDPTLGSAWWSWDSQQAVDEGWLAPGDPTVDEDPYHANATGLLPSGDLWINFRDLSAIVLLDQETRQPLWTLGPDGDFALLEEDGGPAPRADWFFGAHAPEFHGDRVWVHDNGFNRPGASSSRIAEYALDVEARTARLVWVWDEPGWFEPIWGDVDVLPDGKISFTRGHCAKCSPLEDQRTEIVEVDPETDTVTWRLTFDDPHDASYRSERIDGCALFANHRYCPDLVPAF